VRRVLILASVCVLFLPTLAMANGIVDSRAGLEPASLALFGSGLLGLASILRRRFLK
jgi:hypothetical protein